MSAAAVPPKRQHMKILMLGESGVGKSAIVNRLTTNSFDPRFTTTVGVDFRAIEALLDGRVWKIQLWDTAGQENFRTITRSYFRSADGIMLVYDVGDADSFEGIRSWLAQIKESAPELTDIMLVGNKTDQTRAVQRQDAEQLAAEYTTLEHVEMSAKSGENVHDSMVRLVGRVYGRLQREWAGLPAGPAPEQPISLTAADAEKIRQTRDASSRYRCCS